MADIDDLWFKIDKKTGEKVPSARHGRGRRWAARYRDDLGQQRSPTFKKKVDAERYLARIQTDLSRGTYIDPKAGKITVREFAQQWLGGLTNDPSTRRVVELRIRLHVLPALGDLQLKALKPSAVQSWLRGLQNELAANTVKAIYAHLSTLLNAAVDDGLIIRNPCSARSVRPPAAELRRVTPWPAEHVLAVREALPADRRAMVDAGAGLGLRQGEILGLAAEDIDWDRRIVHVRRQVKILDRQLVFAPPKGGKEREVPLPDTVSARFSAHVEAWPPRKVTLPWREPTSDRTVTASLLFTSSSVKALRSDYVNPAIWQPALTRVGVPLGRENGMHALRHWYASVQLDGGTSIKALSEYLGHADAAFTLRVYTHLMPAGEDRARKAVDGVLRVPAGSAF